VSLEPARLQAGRALGRVLSSADGRAMLKSNGHNSSGPIVVALESDCLSTVYKRVTREVPRPPATVAIYFPATDAIEFLGMVPSQAGGTGSPDVHDVHADATIGAVWDYLMTSKKTSLAVSVSAWFGAEASKYKPLHEEPRSPLGRYVLSSTRR